MSNNLDVVWGPTRDLFNWSLSDVFAPVRRQEGFVPPIDLTETETEYIVTMDVPGISKDQIKIEVEDGKLIVSGEKTREEVTDKHNLHIEERVSGKFKRTFELPKTVDVDRIGAIHADGVLKVKIPKSEKAQPKVISVKVG